MNGKKLLSKAIILITLVTLGFFTSCEVGLGASIDTAVPKISISTPVANAVQKGDLTITGTATDEIEVRSVVVNLLENGISKYTYPATHDKASGLWKVIIPTVSEGFTVVADAKYEIQAIATDTDGKTSVATRSVQIDNTAPTVLVNSPSLFNENKSNFFRQLRVSGSAYDASEISSVKVYFYKEGETSTDLSDKSKYSIFSAEGTNSWELTKDLTTEDTFFKNNTVYNFFVVAEDAAGNKNTYFYRYGDFYSKNVLVDTNPNDGDSYIPFPSMMQIGKIDQEGYVDNPISGLSKAKLDNIQTPCESSTQNDSNFLYRSESASSISWGNIEYDIDGSQRAIPLETDISGQIKSTDGTDIITNSVEVFVKKANATNFEKLDAKNVDLDSSGNTVAFNITLKDKNDEYFKSGNYQIQIAYRTIASQNAESPLVSEVQNFGISAGMPVLTETNLSGTGASPVNVQLYSNADSVILKGKALKGDRTPVEKVIVNGYDQVKEIVLDENGEGEWSLELKEAGTYNIELKIDEGGIASLNRTIIIDRTKPTIDNPSFSQDATKSKVYITAFVTDENALEKIEYAFIKDTKNESDVTAEDWKTAQNKSSVNVTLTKDNGEFEQGPWTLFLRATDKAGNVIVEKVDGVLDQDAPVFANEAELKAKLTSDTGYLNNGFSFDSLDYSENTVIAEDNQKIAKISVSAKRNGVVEKEYTHEKTIDKKELHKKDLVGLLSIPSDKEGKWIVSLQVEDENGNKSELTVDFIIDVTKPTIDITTVPDSLINSASPFEFKGTANDDVSSVSKIYISLDNQQPFEEFEGQKTWSYALDIENEGEGIIYAYAVDGAGNESEIKSKPFTFDKAYPEVKLADDIAENFYTSENFEIRGLVSDSWSLGETPIQIIQYEKVGNELVNELPITRGLSVVTDPDGKTGTWEIADLPRDENQNKIEKADIPTKTYVYHIIATDKAGKDTQKNPTVVTVSIDKTPPSTNEIRSPKSKTGKGAIDNINDFTFFGVAEDNEGEARTGISHIEYAIKEVNEEPKEEPKEDLTELTTSGTWEFTKPDLKEGKYFLFVRAFDNAGNKSDFTFEEFHVDFSNPTLKVDDIGDKNELFILEGTVTDTAGFETTSPIKITQQSSEGNDNISFTVEIDESNKWKSISLPVKKDNGSVVSVSEDEKGSYNGTYTYIIEASDWCGKTATVTKTVKFDTKAPVVEVQNLEDNDKFTSGSMTVKGSIEDDSSPVTLNWELVGTDKKGEISTKNTWSIELKDLQSGNYTLKISAKDHLGNESTAETKAFTIDTENPTAETSSDDDVKANNEYGKTYTLSGKATDNLALESIVVTATKDGNEVKDLSDIGISITKNSDQEWVWSGNLDINKENEGQWKFSIKAVDSAGRESTIETRSVLVDVTAPEVKSSEITTEFVEGNGTKYYKNKTINIEGVLEESTSGIQKVEYSIDGENWTSCYSTNKAFEATVSLENTGTQVSFRATDVVGNKSAIYKTEVINIDLDNPTVVEILNPKGNLLLNGKEDLSIKVKVSDTGSGVKSVSAKLGENTVSTISISTDEIAELTIPASDISAYDGTSGFVYIQVEDNVGNKTESSFKFEKDSDDPTVEITSHESNTEVNKTITLKGSTTESQGLAKVEIFVNGSDTASKIFEGNDGFNWSWDINTEDYDNEAGTGTLLIKVVATDNAGNKSESEEPEEPNEPNEPKEPEEISLEIDQKSDRPIITINNVPLSGGYLVGQTTIYGSIRDDDGNIQTLEISSGNANTFTPVHVTNGGFVYIINEADGDKTLYFRVMDKDGTVFTTTPSSDDDNLVEPVLEYTITENEKQTSNAPLTFKLDTNPPAVGDPKIQINGEADSELLSNNMEVGGSKKQFKIITNPTDGNGIAKVSLSIKDNTTNVKTIDAVKVGENWTMDVDTEDIKLANLQFTINVEDNAGSKSSLSRNILVDNTKPTFKVESHKDGDKVTGIVKLIGTTSDDTEGTTGSGIKSIQWLIIEKGENIEDEALKWNEINGTLSWNYQFEGIHELSKYVVGENIDKYADEVETRSNVWALPIYFKITDDVGNYTIETFTLNVDPDGDKPIAEITYPESAESNEDALGGTIRIFGTAEDNVAVAGVQMQIDCNGDGYFKDDDKTALGSLKDGAQNTIYSVIDKDEKGNPVDWHILADGKTSWNMTINSNKEFDPSEKDDTKTINVRVRAIDNNGKLGIWSSPVKIIIDKNAPRIGSANPLRLVQYADGKEISSIPYTPDMWIKGDWYLVGSVQDESGIKEFNLYAASDTDITLSSSDIIKGDVITFEGNQTGYNFKIPLNTTNAAGSKVAFSLEALDSSDAKANIDISIKYDNAAPTVSTLKHGALAIGDGNNQTTVITQSNNAYGIESAVTESGSGFSKLAIFFKRTLNGKTYIYNPAIEEGKTGNKETVESSIVLAEGELPRLVIEKAYCPSDEEIQDDSLKNNDNIRKGGLVRIEGMERQITSVNSSEGRVTFTPPASADDYKKAEFAYALVVDNFKVENTTEYDEYGNPITISNDDGDKVVESVERNGATYEWTLSVNSKNIPDGPIEICYMAYDEAGNCSDLTTISSSVQNKRPAIAKVWLGTDLNGDGKISELEEVEYRSNFTSENAEYEVTLDTTNGQEKLFTAKAKSSIRPEIVGGNNQLYYYKKNTVSDANKVEIKRTGAEEGVVDDISIILNIEEKTLEGETDGKTLKTLEGESDGTGKSFTYQIWDSTEGLVVGKTSQWTKITVIMDVDVEDEKKPEVKIKPLSWVSKNENSLYQNKTEYGHIDLSGDLPEEFTSGGSGVMDRDDKVSGKITFTGTANDDVRLSSISFSFGSDFSGIATYSGNTWTNPDSTIEDGFEFKVEEISLGQGGHKVNWTLSIDTAQITNMAAADVELTVVAVDHANNDNKLEEKTDESGKIIQKKKDGEIIKVDVVPYITGLETTLTKLEKKNPSVYGRSALGKYPVYYYRKTTSGDTQEESIVVKGFNIKSGATVTFAGGATATLNNDMSFTLHENAKSGEIKVTVNSIDSLNNINDNEAKVDNTASDNETKYENAYNRQPNGQNNDLLTDNVEIAIWEINSKAAIAKTGELSEVVMHVNPKNGMLGFAFAHSQDLASYPTAANTQVSSPYEDWWGNWTHSNSTEEKALSYHTWITDWTGVNQIGFVYDQNGNVFGTNGGTDTYTPDKKAGRLGLISSHWGTISDNSVDSDNYTGYTKFRRLRLEYLGITRNGVYASNVNRFAKGDCTQLATTTSGDYTNLYMMYYDNTLGELKFKAGAYNNTWTYSDDVNLEATGFTEADFKFGDFADDAYNATDNNGSKYLPNYKNISIVANQSGANGNSSVRPGIYYSISAVQTSTGDVVVAVWYDDVNKTLWYSYLVDPLANAGNRNSDGAISTEWVEPIAILNGHAGGYCAIKADDGGHIHIAAYSRNDAGSLYYAYLENYTSAPTVVPVDSYGSQGQYITMEVAKDAAGNNIPYIGYYMNSMSYPKYAYLAKPGGGVKAGVDEDNMYTGNWETIMLPTTSSIVLDDINIGVYKDDEGKLQAIPTQTESAGAKNGIAGGNGTSNPVFAYGIAQTGSGYIETAQLK